MTSPSGVSGMTETPERPELKSCPFCDAKLDALSNVAPVPDGIGGEAYYVFCSGCSVEQSTSHDSEADAIEAWNRRASSLGEPVSQEAPWVVWSHERSAWWRANRQGYAGSLFGAGVYSEDEAKAIEDDSHRGDVARLLVDEFERQSRVVGTGANWLRTQLAASRVEAKPQNPCVVFGCECPECSASVISSASPLTEHERAAVERRRNAAEHSDDAVMELVEIIDRLSASAPSPEDAQAERCSAPHPTSPRRSCTLAKGHDGVHESPDHCATHAWEGRDPGGEA